MPRILLTLTALTTAIAFAAGCGNDGASSSGAASVAPAGSLVYGEATLRPEGDQRAALDALVAKFPGEGSAADRIGRLMEKGLAAEDSDLSYREDIEPWLGDEAAFFVSSIEAGGDHADAALLVATDDEDATVEAIEKDGGARKSEHRGQTLYTFPDEDGAAAVVDGWLVVGNEGGVHAAIDTVEEGDSIDDDDRYRETLEDAPEERLGFVYADMPAVLEEIERMPQSAALLGQFRQFFEEPVLVTARANEDGVLFEGTVPASMLAGFPIVAEGSGAAGELPAESWLAFAQPDLGQTLEGYLQLVAGAAGGREMIEQQFRAATGLDLEEDVTSWMGDWSVFVRGTTLDSLDGALVVETSDEAASGRFIDGIARLAREHAPPGTRVGPLSLGGGGEGITLRNVDVPQPIHLFQRDGKVVAAYGDAAATDALDPGETLADSSTFTDAEGALGEGYAVSFFLAFDPILELVDSGPAGSDPGWQEVKPYLEPLAAVVSGARKDGDKVRSAFGVTVD
jgi:Protein of unknown function (DUF3352)